MSRFFSSSASFSLLITPESWRALVPYFHIKSLSVLLDDSNCEYFSGPICCFKSASCCRAVSGVNPKGLIFPLIAAMYSSSSCGFCPPDTMLSTYSCRASSHDALPVMS